MKFCNNKKITTDKDLNQILMKKNYFCMKIKNKINLRIKK